MNTNHHPTNSNPRNVKGLFVSIEDSVPVIPIPSTEKYNPLYQGKSLIFLSFLKKKNGQQQIMTRGF